MKFSITLLLATLLSACAPVAVYERDILARPDMALDADSLTLALDEHIYFSKEASSGGASFAGGGCGCN